MVDKFASDEEELYYTSKNYLKLQYSNKAYIDNTEKEKNENEREIDTLKNEYTKLKEEVENLRKATLYSSTRIGSAKTTVTETSEINLFRLKLDAAKSKKAKAKDEWRKLEEKLKELKSESKQIADDNNPYTRRIKMLENKLDKAMIKYNEAMSIRRTYEQILDRLKEERAGYDNQIAAIQKSLKAKQHDFEEFLLLLQDAKQARSYSEILLKNIELSQNALDSEYHKLIKSHEKETKVENKIEKIDDNKKKLEKQELDNQHTEESINLKNNRNSELEKQVKEFEEADKLIRETTGADDINDICQKFSNLRETKEKLKKERRDLEKQCEQLGLKKEKLVTELNKLKYQGQDEITRKELEDNEKTAERTLKTCEDSRQKFKKAEKLIVDVKAGINMISEILKSQLFLERFIDDNFVKESERMYRTNFQEFLVSDDKDLRSYLNKIMDASDFLYQKYIVYKEEYYNDDKEEKLNREEENGKLSNYLEIEQVYLQQNVESGQNSDYGGDDDLDADYQNKEAIQKNDYIRPYSSDTRSKLQIRNAKGKKK